MKKFIFISLTILFSIPLLWSFAEELEILEGKENIEKVIKSKPIFVIVTTKNTMCINKNYDKWIEQHNQKKKDEGEEDEILNKDKMIEDMKKDLARSLKNDGRRWKLKLINDKSEATEGYILYINIDQINPIPMVSFTALYTLTVYEVGSDKALFKVRISSRLIKTGFVVTIIGLPKDTMKESGELIAIILPKFLRDGVDL